MTELTDQMLYLVQANAAAKLADLSNRYVHAQPSEREAIQAAIQFERWLVESCEDCLL
ncbi:MAG: hypothetical protein JXN61_05065 [Sedimentisphaerales bacterium]|nr:hypothetical protein [Sedimentisphaerales bacterium]